MIDTNQIMPTLRASVAAACLDQPGRPSFRLDAGQFVFTINGHPENWLELTALMGVPPGATQEIDEANERLIYRWPSHADQVFGTAGILSKRLPNYEPRQAQLQAGRLFQRGIEMGQPVVAELGTGTGKSLIYLMVARGMGRRIVVSTSNKALQMQLCKKDAPFVNTIFPSEIALVQGKGNYACREKYDASQLATGGIVSEPLAQWLLQTETGNFEEIDFDPDWKELNNLRIDDHCTGKHCGSYYNCFYYQAKAQRAGADILICNHSLLALNAKYPGADILPGNAVIVVDEAHQLKQYVINALRTEYRVPGAQDVINLLKNHNALAFEKDETGKAERIIDLGKRAAPADIDLTFAGWQAELSTLAFGNAESEIALQRDRTFPNGLALADMLNKGAQVIWDDTVKPTEPDHIVLANIARRIRGTAAKIYHVCAPTQPGSVRWYDKKAQSLFNAPYDVSGFIGRLAGFGEMPKAEVPDHTKCTKCGRTLTAAVVNVLDGKPYGPVCVDSVDPFGDAEKYDLAEWLNMTHEAPTEKTHAKTPIMFTSATIAAPDFTAFLRDCGLPYALEMQAASPFDYEGNSLLFVPDADAPKPNGDKFAHAQYCVDTIREFVNASKGGAFLLFTSYSAMQNAVDALANEFKRQGYPVYIQGNGFGKMEIIKRVKEDGNAILFATKSFFEGVDVPGDALRLVVLDKFPFEAPSPMNQAQAAYLREWARANVPGITDKDIEHFPFMAKDLPEMIINLKQAAGRLIRTAADRGVIAILDNRLITAGYGRGKVSKALPPSPKTSDLAKVVAFFEN